MQTNLVADAPGLAQATDRALINPWGLSLAPTGPLWVSDNQTGLSTLYDGAGQPVAIGASNGVAVPPLGGDGGPTGTVFNGGPGFWIAGHGVVAPSAFLFAGEDGTISGWNPLVDPTHAVVMAAAPPGTAVYKGLALADGPAGPWLYATNFHTGTVDVFDAEFQRVPLADAFHDPDLPAGFAPFGIQAIDGRLFVTYARQDAAGYDSVAGAGAGVIDVFDTQGRLLQHLASGGPLNSPWGLAVAPSDFGQFGGDLLVGNFGDGRINAFDPTTGAFVGALADQAGKPLAIDGLWALQFGNGAGAGSTDTLFFTAGPGDGAHGLLGSVQTPGDAAAGGGVAQPPPAYDPSGDVENLSADPKDEYPIPPVGGPPPRGELGTPTGQTPALFPFGGVSVVAAAGQAAPAAPAAESGGSAAPASSAPALGLLFDLSARLDGPARPAAAAQAATGTAGTPAPAVTDASAAVASQPLTAGDFNALATDVARGPGAAALEQVSSAAEMTVELPATADAIAEPGSAPAANDAAAPARPEPDGFRESAAVAAATAAAGHDWLGSVGALLLAVGAHFAWAHGDRAGPDERRAVEDS